MRIPQNMSPQDAKSIIRTQIICKTISQSIGALAVAGVLTSYAFVTLIHYTDNMERRKQVPVYRKYYEKGE